MSGATSQPPLHVAQGGAANEPPYSPEKAQMRQEYILWNERGGAGGPLLVLLHGLGGNSAVWQSLEPSLAMHWVGRWIAPDFAGHGRSPHRGPYSIERHAADVAALLEGENDVTVVGHSMGGLIAMAIASSRFGV